MITHSFASNGPASGGVAVRYALIPLLGYGIGAACVEQMLDPEGSGESRLLQPAEMVPYGAQPVLVSDTTVYGATCVERMMRVWTSELPKPWLVLLSDVPMPPARAARYRLRALEGRLAGAATLPYLPALRAVEGPEEALADKKTAAAAQKLRRTLGGTK
ncbi:hypothetical protein [Streptomyces sp. NPDC094437]|uniref:hypothetical protein n=1 Tax=Streptomyces sp. NPDC094437 TaxID=3366060 RepID=UPI003825427E